MIRSNIALAFLLLSGSDALTITGRSVRSSFVPARQTVILAAEPKKDEIDIAAVQKEADDALKAAEAALSKRNEKPVPTSTTPPKTPPSPPPPEQLDPKVVAATKAFQKAAAEFQVEAVAAAVGAAAVGGSLGLTLMVQYPSITASVDPSVPPLAGATLLAGSALAVGLQDSQPGRIVRNVLGKPTKAIGTGIAKSIKNSIDRTVDRVVSFPGYVAEETKKKVTTTVQEIESDIKAFPKKVSEAALDAAEDLKEEIIATPGRIVEGTKESVRKTVEGTKQAVQQKTKETQEKIVKSVEEVVAIPTKTVESIASLLEGGEKRDPEVPKPPKLPPPEEAIRQGSNQVQIPRLAAPKLSTPPPKAPPKTQKAAPLPKLDVPKIEIPQVEVPKIEIPKVEIPKVDVPRVDLPKLDLPKMKAPEETTPVAKKPAKKKNTTNEGAQVTASVKALMAELSAERVVPATAKTDNTVAERRRAEEENRKQKEAEKARFEQKQKQEQLNAQKAAERAKAAEQEERKRQQEAQQAEKARLAMEQKQKQEQASAQKAAERAKALELQREQQEERRRQQEAKKAEAEAKRAAQQARQEEQNRKLEQQRAEQAEKRRAAAEAARLEAGCRQQEQARLREEKLKASQQKETPQVVAAAPRPSFLLGTPSQRASAAAPRGVPTIAYWRKRADNGISGKIYGSPNFKDGERVETSSITFGQIENGYVVKTSSGSRYFLSSTPPAPGKAEKALESAKPGATINLSNIFNGSANDAQSQKAKPRSSQPSPKPSTTFSLFGSSGTVTVLPPKKESTSKSVSVKADSPPRATFSLFGLGQPEPESAPTTSKVTKSKPNAPRGVPTLKKWRKNGDKSITGNISGSPNFKENEKVTTSPIVKGNIAAGEVVTTGSGSRYFLN